MEWTLEPGDRIRRSDLHDRYGGKRQGGIGLSAKTPNIFIFSDLQVGSEHGYNDHWEGPNFHYTGEGQRGNQEMVHGNRGIRDHVDDGRSLRVFDGSSGEVIYVGKFGLDSAEPHYTDRAPETGGGPLRNVIVFRLVPISPFVHDGSVTRPEEVDLSLSTEYRPVDESASSIERKPASVDPDIVDRGNRGHRSTQNSLADHIRSTGLTPLSPGLGDPNFDVGWWDGETFVVVEVKSLTKANEIGQLRLGLGQVLDYTDSIARSGRNVRAVLAVEREPSEERWIELCGDHGVTLTWPPLWASLA